MDKPTALTIEITTGHCRGGVGNDIAPGTRLGAPGEISVDEALSLVRRDYARIVPTPPPASEPEKAHTVTHADPVIENRDPEITPPPRAGRNRPRAAGGR